MRTINRSAFLYMDPTDGNQRFAQCGTCRFWRPSPKLCALLVGNPEVVAGATCGLYVFGRPSDIQPDIPSVWAKEAGLETRQVRCQNCAHYRGDVQNCHLFSTLNARLPGLFDLDVKVHPLGCCNANTPVE